MNNSGWDFHNLLRDKSYAFALRIVKRSRYWQDEQKEFVLSRQLLRSGTSVGTMIRESECAQSKADFVNKLSISLKEANETEYWLMLLKDCHYITAAMFDRIAPEVTELLKMLTASIKTAKNNG